MFRASKKPTSTLDDVVELLEGIGVTLMRISARLDDVYAILQSENDEDS